MDAVGRYGRRQRRQTLLQRLDIITERRAQARRKPGQAATEQGRGASLEPVARPGRGAAT